MLFSHLELSGVDTEHYYYSTSVRMCTICDTNVIFFSNSFFNNQINVNININIKF